MPEVHLPHLEHDEEAPAPPSRRFRIPRLVLEVILISSGVFLGLAGEQWREGAHKRELTAIALRDFRSEIEINRKAVAAVKDYHATKHSELNDFFHADAKQRSKMNLNLQGIQPVSFEHAAWDLALATGALANIDQQLAYSLAHVYNTQESYKQLTQGLTQAMYAHPPSDNDLGFLQAVDLYYDDAVLIEPKLVAMYDNLIANMDRRLKE